MWKIIYISLTFIICDLCIKFTPCPAVLPGLGCFEESLDDADGDDGGDHGDDGHVDDVHGDGDHGWRKEDESDDAGGGCGDGSSCDDDHHAHDVCVHDVNA